MRSSRAGSIVSYLVLIGLLATLAALIIMSMQMLYISQQELTSSSGGSFGSEHSLTALGRARLLFFQTSDFWKYVLSLTIPQLEVTERQAYHSLNLVTYVFVGLDITDPRSFLASQIPFMNRINLSDSQLEAPPPLVAEKPPADYYSGSAVIDNSLAAGSDPGVHAIAAAFQGRPALLIYHTHNTEAYVPNAGSRYVEDRHDVTVVGMGTYLAQLLEEKYGIPVYHSRDNHVWDPFWASYNHSLVTVEKVLAQEPQIRYVLDLHNDGVGREKTTVTINGVKYARPYLVVGADDQRNRRWQYNYQFALRLQQKLEQRYPGLSRGILLRKNARYNQHLRNNSLLIEIGGYQNNVAEARRLVEILAELLAELVIEDVQNSMAMP